MQDAPVGSWLRDTHLSPEMFESVRELNHRFLDLIVPAPDTWNSSRRGLSLAVSERIAPLSAAQKSAAASCPYALFDLHFHDSGHWRMRLAGPAQGGIADETPVDAATLEFVRLALFFAWHVASSTKLGAQLLLGMHEATASAFRGATIDCLPALAAGESAHLTARWNTCAAYWGALTGAASRPNPAILRRIQLYGLQIAAASRMQL